MERAGKTSLVQLVQLGLLVAIAALLWSARSARDEETQRHKILVERLDVLVLQQAALAESAQQAARLATRTAAPGASAVEPQQLMAALNQAKCAAAEEPSGRDEKAPVALAPAPVELVREFQQIVDSAIGSRRLRVDDVLRLRALREANPEDPELLDLRDEIVTAINDQRLIPEPGAHTFF